MVEGPQGHNDDSHSRHNDLGEGPLGASGHPALARTHVDQKSPCNVERWLNWRVGEGRAPTSARGDTLGPVVTFDKMGSDGEGVGQVDGKGMTVRRGIACYYPTDIPIKEECREGKTWMEYIGCITTVQLCIPTW